MRPRSSVDRAPASGAGGRRSSRLGGTREGRRLAALSLFVANVAPLTARCRPSGPVLSTRAQAHNPDLAAIPLRWCFQECCQSCQLAIEASDMAILPARAWFDIRRRDAQLAQPGADARVVVDPEPLPEY